MVLRGKALRQAIIVRALAVERWLRALLIGLAAYAVWKFRGDQVSIQAAAERDLPILRASGIRVDFRLLRASGREERQLRTYGDRLGAGDGAGRPCTGGGGCDGHGAGRRGIGGGGCDSHSGGRRRFRARGCRRRVGGRWCRGFDDGLCALGDDRGRSAAYTVSRCGRHVCRRRCAGLGGGSGAARGGDAGGGGGLGRGGHLDQCVGHCRSHEQHHRSGTNDRARTRILPSAT